MPTADIKKISYGADACTTSVLPKVLQTPSGLALLDLQGIINIGKHKLTSSGGFELESAEEIENQEDDARESLAMSHVGDFDFSDVENGGSEVVLKIGKFQRLRGKITKLKMPLAVLRMDPPKDAAAPGEEVPGSQRTDDLRHEIANDRNAGVEVPIVDIIYHKIVFSTRPEPIVYS